MIKRHLSLVFAVTALGCIALTGCAVGNNSSENQTNSKAIPTPQNSMASELASIDAGKYVDPSDPVVSKYQTQFDSLHSICPQAKDKGISDMAVHTQQVELKNGVDENTLSILEAVNQACQQSSSKSGKDVATMMTAYSWLRTKGMTRDQAITEAESVAKQIGK